MGHLSRCRSLIISIINDFPLCRINIITNNTKLVDRFIGEYVESLFFESYNVAEAQQIIELKRFDIVFLDTPNQANENFEYKTKILAVIDDNGTGVLGQNVLIQPNMGKPVAHNCNYHYWYGSEYILLNPSFSNYSSRQRFINDQVQNILVCFGGSDPGHITQKILPVLKNLNKLLKINIVLGHSFQYIDDVYSLVERDERFNVKVAVSDMPKMLWETDIAIISGGSLLYEACALGTPSIVISQNNDQHEEALIFDNKHATINAGTIQNVNHKLLHEKIEYLLNKYSLRKKISETSRKIVTGNGAKHIISRLFNLLSTV